MALVMGQDVIVPFFINQTDTLAGTSAELISPVDGFVKALYVTVQAAVGTGGGVTVEVNGTAVAGLTVTVADSATKGTVYSDTPTAGSSTREVEVGDRLEIIPADAFATSGAISGFLVINTGA